MNYLLFTIIDTGLNLLQFAILIRVILSWIPHDPYGQLIRIIYSITDPLLRPVRDILPMGMGGMDFSPIVVFFLIGLRKNYYSQSYKKLKDSTA